MSDEEVDEFLTIELQSRDAVVQRLLVLHTLVERSMLEALAVDEGVTPEIEERRFDLLAELLASSAASAIAPEELTILQTPVAQIPEEDEVAVILAAEAFGALGKACGLIRDLPLPPQPVGSSPELLEYILGLTPEAIEEGVVLPDEEAAADILEIVEVAHWRADVEFGARLNGGQLTEDEKESIQAVGAEAEASGLFQTYPSGDLKLGHKPIRKWSDDEVETYYIVTLQQRAAIEWLCDEGQDWIVISDVGD